MIKRLTSLFLITLCILTLHPDAQAKDKKNVIFVGNSYVFFNDLPNMIMEIAKSDSQSDITLEVEQYTVGGAKLIDHWQQKKALENIISKQRDFVVFQEQSSWAMYDYDIRRSYETAPKWRKAVTPFAANIALFVTWAKQPYSKWYSNPETSFFKSAIHMQKQLNLHSKKLASLLGAQIIPVGDYWAYVFNNHPEMNLYNPDGSHPSVAGTYLSALIFYRYFTGLSSVKSVSYVPKGMKVKHARTLRRLLSR